MKIPTRFGTIGDIAAAIYHFLSISIAISNDDSAVRPPVRPTPAVSPIITAGRARPSKSAERMGKLDKLRLKDIAGFQSHDYVKLK